MTRRDPIIVTGSGRSGTNWLLNLLDLHGETHCRNEPETITDTPMQKIPYKHFGPLELEDRWDDAVDWAATHVGDLDRPPQSSKAHMHDWSFRSGIGQVPYRRGARKLFRFVMPSLGQRDWELPWWVGSKTKLRDAIPVLKIPGCHRFVMWVLENRPNTKVVHMVRHPGGAMNSWKSRYLMRNDEALVLRANHARLHDVVKESADWAPLFGDIDAMKVMEAEVWFWAYATTALHQCGEGLPNYYSLTYEALIGDQVEQLQRIYQACGLDWSSEVENSIAQRADIDDKRHWTDKVAASSGLADSWRKKLSSEEKGFVERALAKSICADWWDK